MEENKDDPIREERPAPNQGGNASLYAREPFVQGLTFFVVSLSYVLYDLFGSKSFLLPKLKRLPVPTAILFVYSGRAIWTYVLRKIAEGRTLQKSLKENTDLTGKTVVLTGGTAGIGKASTIQLVEWGANVIIGCRDTEKGDKMVEDNNLNNRGRGAVSVIPLDLAELDSVKKFAEAVLSLNVGISFLINNAGIMLPGGDLQISKDGYEKQFATNHLGHFLLTLLLLDNVKKNNGRIITLSSLAHGGVDTEKLFDFNCVLDPLSSGRNSAFKYYSISKLCNIWFTSELQRRLSADPSTTATAYCCHPGVVRTELFRGRGKFLTLMFNIVGHLFLKTPESGAATQLHLCAAPLESLIPGLYYDNCRPGYVTKAAVNPEKEQELWKFSEHLVAKYLLPSK